MTCDPFPVDAVSSVQSLVHGPYSFTDVVFPSVFPIYDHLLLHDQRSTLWSHDNIWTSSSRWPGDMIESSKTAGKQTSGKGGDYLT